MNERTATETPVHGEELWTNKGGIRLFLWENDLIEFYKRLPNPDKQFAVMPGIAHASLQQKNFRLVYHILSSFFSQPEPVYRG